tara:strand:- start:3356 stop:3541 length:186 start_codon:yes stop_codon:yes gene_type:complete
MHYKITVKIKSLYGTKNQEIGIDNIKDIKQVIEAIEYSLKEHESFKDNGLINDINRLINID